MKFLQVQSYFQIYWRYYIFLFSDNKHDPLNLPIDDLDNYDDLRDDLRDDPDYNIDDENIEKLDTDIINGFKEMNGKEDIKIKRKCIKM